MEETNQATKTRPVQKKKSATREWFDSVLFAVVAATLIRWLFMEAFTIPTPSMEKSLLVGDFLFVSKLHYGTRTPKTILQVPLTHQKIWGTNIPSYSDAIQLPQFRLPGFTHIKSGDVVVFNYPVPEPGQPDYPSDLRTNYIKRCIGTPGDVVEVRSAQVYLNGKPMENPPGMQNEYFLQTAETVNEKVFRRYGITDFESYTETYNDTIPGNDISGYVVKTTPATAALLKEQDFIKGVQEIKDEKDKRSFGMSGQGMYPESPLFANWNRDFYGPITVPKKGVTVSLDAKNLAIYRLVIQRYEGNERVEVTPTGIKIDGKAISTYTFKQDYYFMMGDNRHNSADSRFWGFVPDDHIVGKAVFIWMSLDPNPDGVLNKIRWSRLFHLIN